MGAETIAAESHILTASIGVVTGEPEYVIVERRRAQIESLKVWV